MKHDVIHTQCEARVDSLAIDQVTEATWLSHAICNNVGDCIVVSGDILQLRCPLAAP